MATPSVTGVQNLPSNVTLKKSGNVFESDPQSGTTVAVRSTLARDVTVTLALDPASSVKFSNGTTKLVSNPINVPANSTRNVIFDPWRLRRSGPPVVTHLGVSIEPRFVGELDTDPVGRSITISEVTTEAPEMAGAVAAVTAVVAAGVGAAVAFKAVKKRAAKKASTKKASSAKKGSKKLAGKKAASKKAPGKKASAKKSAAKKSRR